MQAWESDRSDAADVADGPDVETASTLRVRGETVRRLCDEGETGETLTSLTLEVISVRLQRDSSGTLVRLRGETCDKTASYCRAARNPRLPTSERRHYAIPGVIGSVWYLV